MYKVFGKHRFISLSMVGKTRMALTWVQPIYGVGEFNNKRLFIERTCINSFNISKKLACDINWQLWLA
ncbi:MAG: hypothetical protein L3J83_04440, partial [Proteobacteria bacterium]|nr:hypothetical protein [Pseudomonadota bacterium]